jgi:hypothetical protein
MPEMYRGIGGVFTRLQLVRNLLERIAQVMTLELSDDDV